jgi:hypothetical protein
MSGRTQVTSGLSDQQQQQQHLAQFTSPHFTSLHVTPLPFTTIMHCLVCMHRHHRHSPLTSIHGMNLRRDVKRLHPSPILLRALCQRRGLLQAETPSKQPLQRSPLSAILPSLPTHTHSRLASERWCLRSEDPVGFFIFIHPSTLHRFLPSGFLFLFYLSSQTSSTLWLEL